MAVAYIQVHVRLSLFAETNNLNPDKTREQSDLAIYERNNVECATSNASDQPAHTSSLINAFAGRLNIL